MNTLLKHKVLDYICFCKLFFESRISIGKVHLQVCDDRINLFDYRLLKEYISSVSEKRNI